MPKGLVSHGAVGRTLGPHGRFVTTENLTESQVIFVRNFVALGGDWRRAAEASNLRPEAGNHYQNNPKVCAAIRALVAQKLETEGGTVGYGVLVEIARDRNAPPNVRRLAARDLMTLAGFGKMERADGSDRNTKTLAEMTRAELEEVVRSSAAVLEAAQRVKPPAFDGVAEAVDAPNDAQPAQEPHEPASV